MIRRVSLPAKILLLALTNVLLLGALVLVFAQTQFRFNLSSYLLAPAKATISSVSRLIALELPNTPRSSWNALLAQYSTRYPAKFYLFDSTGNELAGEPVTLPPSFAAAVRTDPFARPDRQGPPPFENEPPPFGDRPHDHHGGPPPSNDPFPNRDSINAPLPGPPPHGVNDSGQMRPDGPPPERERDGHRHDLGPGFPLQDAPLALTRSTNPVRFWAGVRVPIWMEGRRAPIHATLVWEIRSLWTERAFFDYRPWLVVVLATVATLLICWVPLIRSLTRSIRDMTAATGQIAEGHFEIQLPTRRRDELGQLSRSINLMAQRLSGYVYGQKRFLGDIAHELSSPVARIQMGLGILEQRITGSDAEYVVDVREDAEHMSALVSELLAFSKSQVSQQQAPLRELDLPPLIEHVLSREAATGLVSVDPSIAAAPQVIAIPELLERALANIVRNALRYAPGAPIVISAARENGHVSISVADGGPGLPENELDNVFRPFYRPEFARQRETGGTGLGLAIVRDCIESCHGTVFCRNVQPHGLEVVIRLAAA